MIIDALDEYTAKNLSKAGGGAVYAATFWGLEAVMDYIGLDHSPRETASDHLLTFGIVTAVDDTIDILAEGMAIPDALMDDPMFLAGFGAVHGLRYGRARYDVADELENLRNDVWPLAEPEDLDSTRKSQKEHQQDTSFIRSVGEDRFRSLYGWITKQHEASVAYAGESLDRDHYASALEEVLAEDDVVPDQYLLEWKEGSEDRHYRIMALGREGPEDSRIPRDEPLLEANVVISNRRVDDPINAYIQEQDFTTLKAYNSDASWGHVEEL